MEKIDILDCKFDKVTMPELISLIEGFVKKGTFHFGCGINADLIVKMDKHQEFKNVVKKADVIFADGMSLVLASRLLRKTLPARIGAIDLFEALLPVAVQKQYKIFLLGTKGRILKKAVDFYQSTYPGLKISGCHNGFWSLHEEDSVINKINKCSPDLLFLGFSSPKRELFIEKNRDKLNTVSFALGVGGTFDIDAGEFSRAPVLMQKICLEWFWRLLQEPKRMFLRYTINNLKFLEIYYKTKKICG